MPAGGGLYPVPLPNPLSSRRLFFRQNLCSQREWAELVVDVGAHWQLETLLDHDDEMVVRYAAGALSNIELSLSRFRGSVLGEVCWQGASGWGQGAGQGAG